MSDQIVGKVEFGPTVNMPSDGIEIPAQKLLVSPYDHIKNYLTKRIAELSSELEKSTSDDYALQRIQGTLSLKTERLMARCDEAKKLLIHLTSTVTVKELKP